MIEDSSTENGLLVEKSTDEALAAANTFSVDQNLTSESSLDEHAGIMQFNMLFEEDEAVQT